MEGKDANKNEVTHKQAVKVDKGGKPTKGTHSKELASDPMKPAIIKSVALHGLILASVLLSISFSDKPLVFAATSPAQSAPKVDIVQATFVDSNVIEQKKREKAQAEAAAKRRAQEQRKQEQARQKAEAERKRKAEEARKKREEEKREQERIDKLERERQKEAEIARQQEIKRQREEQERKAEEQRKREQAQRLAEQLKQEQAAMDQARQKQTLSEIQKYNSLVTQAITRRINADGLANKSCNLVVRVAPNGLVIQVRVIKGDTALCREAETAILRAETLPVSKDPVVYEQMKSMNITVRF